MDQHTQPASAGYTPRPWRNDLKDIVEDYLAELEKVYQQRFAKTYGPLHPRAIELFEQFSLCGDPHHGFLRLRCPDCGENRILPFS